MKQTIIFRENSTQMLRNPAAGWVVYVENCYGDEDNGFIYNGMTVEEFWQEYDRLCTAYGLLPSILYIRESWRWFEPREGKYAWKDGKSELSRLVAGAQERSLQLAFRVLVDSTDSDYQAVPDWVFQAGAERHRKYENAHSRADDVYVNDPVFLWKFDRFLEAFAGEYDDADRTAWVDGQGMGDWGEMNRIFYDPCRGTAEDAAERVMDLYLKHFHNVLLGAQVGSANGYSYGAANGYVLRRDSFGSPRWLPKEDKEQIIRRFHGGTCVFAESCYHGLEHSLGNAGRWQEVNLIEGWPLSRVLKRVLDDALECRANTLDYRMLSDMECWGKDYPAGTQEFIRHGGYRLMPTSVTVPDRIRPGERLLIEHRWKNGASGRFPNHCRGWDHKYQIAFALFSRENGERKSLWLAGGAVEPSDWIMENGEYEYCSVFEIPERLQPGLYDIGCAIVNTKKENRAEIRLAVEECRINGDGWVLLSQIEIK